MIRAYEELVDFIGSGTTPESVADYSASAETRNRVAMLLDAERDNRLSDDERRELDSYLQLEHLMRLAKAKARRNRR